MRRTKFCPKCGRQTDKFYDSLCKDCFLQKIKLLDLPEKITIRHCKICGKFFGTDKSELILELAINDALSKLLTQKNIQSASYRIEGNKIYSEVVVESDGLRKAFDLDFNLIEKATICKFCSMKLSGYFNTIIQIRNGDKAKKILEEINSEIAKLNKKDEFAFISKIENLKNGVDVYIGSKSAANKVVNFLKTKHKFKTKITRRQHGQQEGKNVYRDTILILLSD